MGLTAPGLSAVLWQLQIIFDVGHQAYGHKILTGRRDRMHTIRQTGGLSGVALNYSPSAHKAARHLVPSPSLTAELSLKLVRIQVSRIGVRVSMTPLGLATARHLCLLRWAWLSAAISRSDEFSMRQRISEQQMSIYCSACDFADG